LFNLKKTMLRLFAQHLIFPPPNGSLELMNGALSHPNPRVK